MSTRRAIGWAGALAAAAILLVITRSFFILEDEAFTTGLATRPPRESPQGRPTVHRPAREESPISGGDETETPDIDASPDTRRNALFGIVVDVEGHPVADARLTLQEQDEKDGLDDIAAQASWDVAAQSSRRWRTVSDTRGRFGFPADIEGGFVLTTKKESAFAVVTRLKLPRKQDLRVTIRRSATLRGRVITLGSERGIPHAEIHALVLNDEKPGGVLLHTTSLDDGSFVLALPRATGDKAVVVNIRARAKGYAPSGVLGASILGDTVSPAYSLVPLARGRRLTLRLVDHETSKIPADAELLIGSQPLSFAFRASSDEAGTAIIEDFPPCKSVYVVVRGDAWVLDTTGKDNVTSTESMSGLALPVAEHGDANVTVPVAPAGHLVGRVIDIDSGHRVAGVDVEVGRTWDFTPGPSYPSPRSKIVTTDDEGRFAVGGLWRTETFARVMRGDWIHWPKGWSGEPIGKDGFPWRRYRKTARLSNSPEGEIVIFARRTATVIGRVLDGNGHPVAGALVEEAPNEKDVRLIVDYAYEKSHPVRTDRQGYFRMPYRPPLPRFRLQVSHRQFLGGEFGPFALSPANVTDAGDLVLAKGALVTVEAIGPRGPLEGLEVLLTALDPKNARMRPVHVTTGADGRGMTTALGHTRVSYRVLRAPEGYTLGHAPPNPVSLALDGADRLVFRLVPPHFLSGRIVGPGGEPVPKADFLAHRVDGQAAAGATRRRFRADALGTFREGVAKGSIWEIEHVVRWAEDDLGNRREVRYAVKSGSPIEADVPTTIVAGKRLPAPAK